mmetsp:Transcript_10063/g.29659  ORF Transcript_10063/g.29659 Transcript_10063/m.29659 type:complete len:297 (+) Transcript_10063:158-1048(+)
MLQPAGRGADRRSSAIHMRDSSATGSRPMYSAYSRVAASYLEEAAPPLPEAPAAAAAAAAAAWKAPPGEEASADGRRQAGFTSRGPALAAGWGADAYSDSAERTAAPWKGAARTPDTRLAMAPPTPPCRFFSSSMRRCSVVAASWRKRTWVCSRQKSRSQLRSSTLSSCTRRSASCSASLRLSSAERRRASACHLALVASASARRFSSAARSRSRSARALARSCLLSSASASKRLAWALASTSSLRSSLTSSSERPPPRPPPPRRSCPPPRRQRPLPCPSTARTMRPRPTGPGRCT